MATKARAFRRREGEREMEGRWRERGDGLLVEWMNGLLEGLF